MRTYTPTNIRTYDIAFQKLKEKTEKEMLTIFKKTIEGCLNEIVDTSPFLTGSYIASHRIGINAEDMSDTVFKEEGMVSKAEVQSRAKAEASKLKGLKLTDTVYISNSVGYSTKRGYSWARNIEYSGWDGNDKHKGPYLTYQKAALKTINKIPEYVSDLKISGEGI